MRVPRHTPLRRLPGAAWRSMSTAPRFTPVVAGLPSIVPFVAPEQLERERGRPFRVRLGANELTLGPSPAVVEAIGAAASGSWMYGDPKSHQLRQALAEHHAVRPENIVVGEGIDGLLNTLAQLMVAEGDAVVATAGTYPTFGYFVAGRGGVVHTVPYGADSRQDLDALVARAAEVDAKARPSPTSAAPRSRVPAARVGVRYCTW